MGNWPVLMRVFGYVVVALMAAAMLYAAFISVKYWSGIGV